MTKQEINSINLKTENDPQKLKEVIKYWTEEAILAQYQLMMMRGKLSNEQIISSFNLDKIKEIMNGQDKNNI
jgi:hypothetical protein